MATRKTGRATQQPMLPETGSGRAPAGHMPITADDLTPAERARMMKPKPARKPASKKTK